MLFRIRFIICRLIFWKFWNSTKNIPEKKTEIYQTFLASLKGGGYPKFGKTPNFFRFFPMKASLITQVNYPQWIGKILILNFLSLPILETRKNVSQLPRIFWFLHFKIIVKVVDKSNLFKSDSRGECPPSCGDTKHRHLSHRIQLQLWAWYYQPCYSQ